MQHPLTLLLALGAVCTAGSCLAASDTVSLYLTDKGSDKRLAPLGTLKLSDLKQPTEKQQCVFVDPA